MESNIFSLDVAKKSLDEEGFFRLTDPSVWEDILDMERKGFPFWSEEGLDFCIKHVLSNQRIRSIIKSWFGERCVLMHWIRYRARPGRVICFRGGGPKAGRRRLMVQLLAKGSQVEYWARSHLHELPTEETEYLFYEIPQPSLHQAGLRGMDDDFKDAESVVLDARLGLELKRGYAITFVFATTDVIARWPAMLLPNLPALRHKVRGEMESAEIGVNFAFGDSAPTTGQEFMRPPPPTDDGENPAGREREPRTTH